MTIKDIAKEAGYSVGTVSRVLNNSPDVSEKARKKILEAVEKNGFKLNSYAKNLKQGSSDEILIIVKKTPDEVFLSMGEAMQRLAFENGLPSSIKYIDDTENEVLEAKKNCEMCMPRGIIFLGEDPENFKKDFKETDIPCVLAAGCAQSLGFDNLSSVSTADAPAAKAALSLLFDLGHEKIGIISGFSGTSAASDLKMLGVREAFRERRVPFDEKICCEKAFLTLKGGYDAMNRLIEKYPRLTAVFAMSDAAAAGALRALKDKNIAVPEEVSVAGFGGAQISGYTVPRLTTIFQNDALICERSVKILSDKINNKNSKAVHEIIPFETVQRESTAGLEKK